MILCVLLPGCQTQQGAPQPSTHVALRVSGHVHGGQQPVSNATIGLYAAGTHGAASDATSLLTAPVLTDSDGSFDLDGLYSCPSPDAELFLTARGGNPGLAAGTTNPGIGLMATLGACKDITAATFVNLNEVTTIGAVWPLAGFMNSPTEIGSDAGDPLFADAIIRSLQLVDPSRGAAPGALEVSGYAVEVSKVNHLADIIASCINSTGGIAGDGSLCGSLFAAATPPGGIAPVDTITAALRIAQNPAQHVASLFAGVSATAPFQPGLAITPSDWNLKLVPIPASPSIAQSSDPATGATRITIADSVPGASLHYTLDGTPPGPGTPVYTGPFTLQDKATVSATAIVSDLLSNFSTVNVDSPSAPGHRAVALSFVTQPSDSSVGNPIDPAIVLVAEDESGNPVAMPAVPVTLTLSSDASSGLLTGQTTQTAQGASLSFAGLAVTSPGTGYTLTASAAGLASSVSTAFSVYAQNSALPGIPHAETPVPAMTFSNSVGINVHLNFSNTLYTKNFPLVLASLRDLHIQHVRDGLDDMGNGQAAYYQAHQTLAQNGIRADFISSLNQPASLLQAYPARVGDMESLEAPNEYDTSGDPNWASNLRAYLGVLNDAVHGTHPMSGITLIGPSLVNTKWYSSQNSYAQLGNVGALIDEGNLHNYPGGRNPGTPGWTPQGYGSIAFALSMARTSWPSATVTSTEDGYWDNASTANNDPDTVIARYSPRLPLEQFLHGITRTYIYELADDQLSGGFYGLLRADGTAKPAYTALKSLMQLVSDPGAAYSTTSLSYGISNGSLDLHHLLLQKRDGTLLLALWIEEPCYDVNTKASLEVPSRPVSVNFGKKVALRAIHHWQDDGSATVSTSAATVSSLPVSVSDNLTVIEFTAP